MKLTTILIAAMALSFSFSLSSCDTMKKDYGSDSQTSGTGMHTGAGMKPKTDEQKMNAGSAGSGAMPSTPPVTGRTTAPPNN